jgi:hypothetical protein
VIVLTGLLVMLDGRVPALGHLPGDILFRLGRVSIYVPIVTCLVTSIIPTIARNRFLRWFGRA